MKLNTIKKASALLFLLSFLMYSNGNNCTYSDRVETTELVEKLSHSQAAFSLFQYKNLPLKPGLLTAHTSFHFKIFQLRQDQNIYQNYLKQQQVIIDYSYVLPNKKVMPFSIKEPFPLS